MPAPLSPPPRRPQYKMEKDELQSRVLNASVWHHDTLGRNLFLGEVEIALSTWDWGNTQPEWFNLQPRVRHPPPPPRPKAPPILPRSAGGGLSACPFLQPAATPLGCCQPGARGCTSPPFLHPLHTCMHADLPAPFPQTPVSHNGLISRGKLNLALKFIPAGAEGKTWACGSWSQGHVCFPGHPHARCRGIGTAGTGKAEMTDMQGPGGRKAMHTRVQPGNKPAQVVGARGAGQGAAPASALVPSPPGAGLPPTGELHIWVKDAQSLIPIRGGTVDSSVQW